MFKKMKNMKLINGMKDEGFELLEYVVNCQKNNKPVDEKLIKRIFALMLKGEYILGEEIDFSQYPLINSEYTKYKKTHKIQVK